MENAGLGRVRSVSTFFLFHQQIPFIHFHLTLLYHSQPTWALPLNFTSKDLFDGFICLWSYSSSSLINSQWLTYWKIYSHLGLLWQTTACTGFTIRPGVIKSEFFLCAHYNLLPTSAPLPTSRDKTKTLELILGNVLYYHHHHLYCHCDAPWAKPWTYIMPFNPFNPHNTVLGIRNCS